MHQADHSSALTAQQLQVISLLSNGNTINDAAVSAGVSRNTIGNWRRAVPAFAAELEFATSEQARAWQENFRDAVPLAIQTITAILNDPASSASIRLRAAGMILKLAGLPRVVQDCAPKTEIVHKSAQLGSSRKTPVAGIFAVEPSVHLDSVHNSAQSPGSTTVCGLLT